MEIFVFIDRILVGLTDQPDIKMLCHLTLVRLSIVSPTAVAQREWEIWIDSLNNAAWDSQDNKVVYVYAHHDVTVGSLSCT